jgi:hypothetical protein
MSIILLENYIKTLLKENKESIKVINIFDFDMTLFKSEEVPKHWNTKSDGYWWNPEESLNQAYYKDEMDNLWIEDSVYNVKQSAKDPSALTVMCTARSKTSEIVHVTNNLLRLKGLKFDDNCLFYKPQNFKGSTADYKTRVVNNLLNTYIFTKKINFWEDNETNLNAISKYINYNNKKNNRQIEFNSVLVRA